jgi:ribonucleoside-diphosphate reductase alpha chain
MENYDMMVTKRNGNLENISFDKILNRIKKIGKEVNININYSSLSMKVIDQLYDNIPTTKIDDLTCEQCAAMSTLHPDYSLLASRIFVSNIQKNTLSSFCDVVNKLYNFIDLNGNHCPIISENMWKIVNNNKDFFDNTIDYERDYLFDYFGLKTLERSYLFRINNIIVERPQHMWMRVAVGIHGDDLESVKLTYDLMSLKYFTHATPTLFNSGTNKPQLSSCYLVAMEDDSLEGIFNTLKDCANISKWSGGIGLHIHNIRGNNSLIRGTNGKSTGIVPMLKVFNDTARFINQGGKRNGSFAIYLEPWHSDIEDFLEMKKNHGDEEMRARDLFYGLWVPDLFMKRVKNNLKWSLFCPDECPGLSDVHSAKFEELYEKYESENRARKIINARDLWFKIMDSQMETGTPYILYKDAANLKSNQKNLGTIKSSNLCTEVIQHSNKNETAVCNLASVALPSFVNKETKEFDYENLHNVVKVITSNLNKIIDINFYPTEKTRRSNLLHRPIGIGVQGLADTFILMDVPFHSDTARQINKLIFETMYHASLERSNELAIERNKHMRTLIYNKDKFIFHNETPETLLHIDDNEFGHLMPIVNEIMKLNIDCAGAYSSFIGSPASNGILQFDMWNVTPSDRYEWDSLRTSIMKYGIRNSLLLAPMPTASTSQILGFNECFEPLTSNIYSRRTLAGEFILANKYLMNDLIKLNLWNESVKNNIIANNGSIQQLTFIPENIRNKYKTVWEIPMKHLIDMSADRGAFICQSQSLNLWLEDPNYASMTSMHFYSWSKGLKTGIYYLRRKAKHQAQQFTLEPEKNNGPVEDDEIEHSVCESCSA